MATRVTTAGGRARRTVRSHITSGPWRHSTAWDTTRGWDGGSPWVRPTTP
jgi:hypothetical protein